MKNQYDIIIIGCGLVGGSLAVSLPNNLSIAVIDSQSPMTQQPGYLALNRLSCDILKILGVWDDITQQSSDSQTPIKKIAISEIGDTSTDCLVLHAEDIGASALGYVTSTNAIRNALFSRIQSQENITLFCPNRAEAIEWPDEGLDHVVVKLYGPQSQFEVSQKLQAKLVIMADGGRSMLRQQLGFEPNEKKTDHHIVITQLKADKPHQNIAFERFTSQGPIALLPLNQDEYVLVWTMNALEVPHFLEKSERALFADLKNAYGSKNFGGWCEIGQRKTYPIICSHVKNPIKTRLVLMGNAARTVHPVGAQGFNLSLKDVLILNEFIRDAQAKQCDIGGQKLLQNYVTRRQEDTEFVLYFTQSLLNVFSWDFPFLKTARTYVMSWINQSAHLKQAILEKTTGGLYYPRPSTAEVFDFTSVSVGAGPRTRPLDAPSQKATPAENHCSEKAHIKHYDIIILGNRLVGSTLACALNHRYRIAILDKASTPPLPSQENNAFQLRINAYNRASEELLRILGIWERLPPERLFAFDKIWATHEGNNLSFASQMIGETHLGHFIENDLVTHFLHQHITETLPHIDFIDNTCIEQIQPTSDYIRVMTTHGESFSAKLLVGCDGAQSVTRQLLGLPISHHPYYQRCIVGNIFF